MSTGCSSSGAFKRELLEFGVFETCKQCHACFFRVCLMPLVMSLLYGMRCGSTAFPAEL